MAGGRPAGIRLSFLTAYIAACNYAEYWYREEKGIGFSAWRGSIHLGIVKTKTMARERIVRDFEQLLMGGKGFGDA